MGKVVTDPGPSRTKVGRAEQDGVSVALPCSFQKVPPDTSGNSQAEESWRDREDPSAGDEYESIT